MISRELAQRLRTAGLVWHPARGDAFQFARQDMDEVGTDVFVLSDLTIEAHHFPSGTVLGFNGTTEWALDSVSIEDALWLPREDQLREALKDTFVALECGPGGWRVRTVFRGEPHEFAGSSAAEAYGRAVLSELEATR